ncbi:MAG: hypothetical protein SGI91_06370 [Alphaproteobacteria bacterium]|nr:hypothetical protein [Alphaproteobacteria bacterium]
MRVYLLIVGVFAAVLAFSATPASAHAHGHGDVATAAADADAHDADHDADHNPVDHSHPIGDDDYHSKASHSSLDVAHCNVPDAPLAGFVRAHCLPSADQPLRGIALSPPVRPPLG